MKSATFRDSRPSGQHPNRKPHNWLAYDQIDRSLIAVAPLFCGTVYDLGCGEAPYRQWILQQADRYVGVDWANSLHDVQADIVANLDVTLPIEKSVANTVLSISVLEHLRNPQDMLNETWRILRPGGYLVLQVPWQWWIHEAPHDYYRYTPYGLRYLLEQAGFEDVDVQPQGGFFTMLVLKLNYFSRRFIRGPLPVKVLLAGLFRVAWYLGQLVAPLLDHLDRNQTAETAGYFITAKKPAAKFP